MRFYPSAAAAQEAGFRACKRCRPDASPGSPEWNVRADLAARAMRLISDGVVDRESVTGLARRLGYSERQVNRAVTAELGAGPLALARAQRAQTARVLTETTTLPLSEIAFAAGFASIRQFNATIRDVFAATPGELRERSARRVRRPTAPRARNHQAAARVPAADRHRPPAHVPRRPRHPRRGVGDRRRLPADHEPSERDGDRRAAARSVAPAPGPRPRRPTPSSNVSCSCRTSGTWRPPSSAAGGCSTWTPIRRRSRRSCPGASCCGRPWRPARDGGCPGMWTGRSWRSGPCSGSRSRWRPPAVSARG